jgi:RND family efflux transporter MFP subunit
MAARLATPLLAAALLAACSGQPDALAERAAPSLATTPVSRGEIIPSQRWTGIARAANSALLNAQTSGVVEQVAAEVGDDVAKGDLLLALRDAAQRAGRDQAAAALRAARAERVDAGKELERVRELVARKLLAPAALDQVTARFDAARAHLRAAEAALAGAEEALGYTRISAPYAGVVQARHVEPGEAVQPGQPLVSLAAPGLWWIEVSLPASIARALDAAAAIEVQPDSGAPLRASDRLLFPGTEAGSQTTTLRVVVQDAAGRIHEGDALSVALPLPARLALTVPAASIVRRSEVTGVYLLGADGHPLLRAVRLGSAQGDLVEVLAGLSEGDAVITEPTAALQALRQVAELRRD